MKKGCFVVVQSHEGFVVEYRLDGEVVLLETVSYTTLDSAKRGIRAMQEYFPDAPIWDAQAVNAKKPPNPKFEMYKNNACSFFRFRAKNGKLTATSNIFRSLVECAAGVSFIRGAVQTAPVFMEVDDALIPMDVYTQTQVDKFKNAMFQKDGVAAESPAAPNQEAAPKRSFFQRLFGSRA